MRALISDMDVKVTQGHVLLDRSVTDLEHALASHEAGVKGKIAGTEKRLALQEAAMKERVISLEVPCAVYSHHSYKLFVDSDYRC